MSFFNSLIHNKILFLFPHPDDESYSCSGIIQKLQKQNSTFYLLYLSTGVPVKNDFVPPMANKYSYDEYIKIRENEWTQAMNLLRLQNEQYYCMGYPTRTTIYHIHEIVISVMKFIRLHRISIVFCSPSEGAHPDHDICSYIGSTIAKKISTIFYYEYTGYFLHKNHFKSGVFLTNFKKKPFKLLLSSQEKKVKKRLFSIYRSQSIILDN